MIYVAAPHSDPDLAIKDARVREFYEFETTKYSQMPDDWVYWQQYSEQMLSKCDGMVLLLLEGWDKSTGVLAELRTAETTESHPRDGCPLEAVVRSRTGNRIIRHQTDNH